MLLYCMAYMFAAFHKLNSINQSILIECVRTQTQYMPIKTNSKF